jgi:5'-phosphate synthase pdxT subunit
MNPIGVLALQGDFAAQQAALGAAGFAVREVRAAADLADLGGLVLPGGESTTQLHLLRRHQLEGPLRAFVAGGAPVLPPAPASSSARRGWSTPRRPPSPFWT